MPPKDPGSAACGLHSTEHDDPPACARQLVSFSVEAKIGDPARRGFFFLIYVWRTEPTKTGAASVRDIFFKGKERLSESDLPWDERAPGKTSENWGLK